MKKINMLLFIMGSICIALFIFSIHVITTDRNIRLYGELRKAPIVELYGRISRPNGGCSIQINNKILDAGSVINDSFSLGDSILVRYISGESNVIQERIPPNRYYWYYALSGILLFVGSVSVFESFKGKDMSDYKSYSNEEIKEWMKKKVFELLKIPLNSRKK